MPSEARASPRTLSPRTSAALKECHSGASPGDEKLLSLFVLCFPAKETRVPQRGTPGGSPGSRGFRSREDSERIRPCVTETAGETQVTHCR